MYMYVIKMWCYILWYLTHFLAKELDVRNKSGTNNNTRVSGQITFNTDESTIGPGLKGPSDLFIFHIVWVSCCGWGGAENSTHSVENFKFELVPTQLENQLKTASLFPCIHKSGTTWVIHSMQIHPLRKNKICDLYHTISGDNF